MNLFVYSYSLSFILFTIRCVSAENAKETKLVCCVIVRFIVWPCPKWFVTDQCKVVVYLACHVVLLEYVWIISCHRVTLERSSCIKDLERKGPHILRPEPFQVFIAPHLGFVGGVTGSSVLLENPAMIPMGVVQPWQNFLLHHVQVNCSVYLNPLGYENQRRFEAARWNCCPHHYRGWFLGFQVWFQPHWSAVDILW